MRLYSDYMHEYGELDSDYVFVNLWVGRIGRPLCYPTVHQLVARIRALTGIDFTAHMLRHTHATGLIRRGVPIEIVARLLTQATTARRPPPARPTSISTRLTCEKRSPEPACGTRPATPNEPRLSGSWSYTSSDAGSRSG